VKVASPKLSVHYLADSGHPELHVRWKGEGMVRSVTKRSRVAEYATYCGLALWLAALALWLEGHLVLCGLCGAAGMILIIGAIRIGRPERRLRSAGDK
jgi:hypothetical protein